MFTNNIFLLENKFLAGFKKKKKKINSKFKNQITFKKKRLVNDLTIQVDIRCSCLSITYQDGCRMNWHVLKSRLNIDGMICLQVTVIPSPADQQTGFSYLVKRSQANEWWLSFETMCICACVCVRLFSNEGNSEASGPSIWPFRSLSLNLFQVWPDVTACGTLAVHSSQAKEITGHLWSVILD